MKLKFSVYGITLEDDGVTVHKPEDFGKLSPCQITAQPVCGEFWERAQYLFSVYLRASFFAELLDDYYRSSNQKIKIIFDVACPYPKVDGDKEKEVIFILPLSCEVKGRDE